jgi:hypothetical protein
MASDQKTQELVEAIETLTDAVQKDPKERQKDLDARKKKNMNHRQQLGEVMRKAGVFLGNQMKRALGVGASTILGSVKEGFSEFGKFESIGLSFNKSLTQNMSSSRDLAESIHGVGNSFTSMGEAFALRLETQNVGLNVNNKSLQNLYKQTRSTGEDFKKLSVGLKGATAGMANSDALVTTLNESMTGLVGSMNVTRTQLIEAMQGLSEATKDMINALGVQGVQESQMQMRGLLKNEALFKSFQGSFQQLLGPGGLQKSILLGVNESRANMLKGGVTLANTLTSVFQQADMAKQQRGGMTGDELGPEIMGVFQQAGLINTNAIRLQEEIFNSASEILGKSVEDLKAIPIEDLVAQIEKTTQERAEQDKNMAASLDNLKRTILMPFIEAGQLVAVEFKKFLGENKTGLRSFATKMAIGILKFVQFAKTVGDFIKDHVIPNLRAIVTALVAMKAAKAAGGVGKLIGGAIGSIFGPAGALIGSAIGGGVAALAAGTTAGVMTHDALKGLEDKNKTEDEFDKMIASLEAEERKRSNDERNESLSNIDQGIQEQKPASALKMLTENMTQIARIQIKRAEEIKDAVLIQTTSLGSKLDENNELQSESTAIVVNNNEVTSPLINQRFNPGGG